MKIYNYIIYVFSLAFVLFACANIQAPSGGKGITTPPTIKQTEPINSTLNFKDNKINITFSSWMNRNSVLENIFVSPNVNLLYDWSGKTLNITIDEKLDTNTTYAITLGTEYQDFYQNKPEAAYTLIFSTGNQIDSGKIKGRVFGKKNEGIFIYAYFLDNKNQDTLNINNLKPEYKTQSGANGNFEIKALKNGKYRIFAVSDVFKDGIFQDGIDDFGAPTNDVLVKQDSSSMINIKIAPSIDKYSPELVFAESLTNHKIIVEFNEYIDTSFISINSFILTDSIESKIFPLLAANINITNFKKVDLLTKEPLDTNITYKIKAINDSNFAIRDTSLNMISDSLNFYLFDGISTKDTAIATLSKLPFKDSTKNIYPEDGFDFIFSEPIKKINPKEILKIIHLSDSLIIDTEIKWNADNSLFIKPKKRLNDDNWYSIIFNSDSIYSLLGKKMKDTIINTRFKTMDCRDFGEASGSIVSKYQCSGSYYVSLISDKKTYTCKVDSLANWYIKEIPEGIYKIEVFCDSNNNGIYDYGNSFPFNYSEVFYFIDKEVNIKPRWKIENIKIELDK